MLILTPGKAYTNLRYKDTGDPEVFLWDGNEHVDTIYAHQSFLFIDWVQENNGVSKSLKILGPKGVASIQVSVIDLDAIQELKEPISAYDYGDFIGV